MRDIAPDLGPDGAPVLAGGADQLLARARRAAALEHVGLVLVAEPLERRQHRVGRALTQSAQAGRLDGFSQPLQLHDALHPQERVEIDFLVPRARHRLQDLQHPPRPFAAGDAFAAALGLDEFHEVLGEIDHAGGFVDDDQPARPHDGAEGLQFLVIGAQVEMGLGHASPRGAADLHRLAPLLVRDAAADGVDHFAQRRTHGHFDQARPLHHPGEGEHLGPLALLGSHPRVPVRPPVQDDGKVGEGLDVVDHGGLPEQPLHGGERRPGARHPAHPLDGVDQGGFLAANERTRPHLESDREIDAAVEDVVTDQAVVFRLHERLVEALDRQRVFGADVDVSPGRPDGVGRDQHPFQEPVRVAFAHRAVHEGARIPFVGVADQVLLVRGRVAGELPLHPGQESAPPAAPEPALEHLVDHFLRGHAAQDTRNRAVPPVGYILVDVAGVDDAAPREHHAHLPRKKRVILEEAHPVPGHGAAGAVLAERQFPGHPPIEENRFEQRVDLVRGDGAEADPAFPRHLDIDDGLVGAHPVAPDLDDLARGITLEEEFPDRRDGLVRPRAQAAGPRPDGDHRMRDPLAPQGGQQFPQRLGTPGARAGERFRLEVAEQAFGDFTEADPAFSRRLQRPVDGINTHFWTPFLCIPG